RNWRGRIPFILLWTHDQIASESADRKHYFHQLEVWRDVESIFAPYLYLYPDDAYERNRFAKYACDCGNWEAARRLLGEVADKPDMTVFGGMAVYNYYCRKADR